MRVVAGKYKGRNLLSPKDDSVRPTTTRIKETIFNVIQFRVAGSRCLDLFSGSGALGIECLSRGAEKVTFVDRSKDSIELTSANLERMEGNTAVFMMDGVSFLKKASERGEKFDLIFLDPPYKTTLAEEAIDVIFEKELLEEGGMIIFEHSSDKSYALEKAGYKQKTKEMGTVTCEFISEKKTGIFCGSFDPVTKGHEAVIEEALRSFDEVIAACLINEEKEYMFSSSERLELLSLVCGEHKGARAVYSEKTAVETAKEEGASAFIRGIRNEKDREYEEKMAAYNLEKGGIKTVFIEPGYLEDVSSTLVREEIKNGIYKNIPPVTVNKITEYRGKNGNN